MSGGGSWFLISIAFHIGPRGQKFYSLGAGSRIDSNPTLMPPSYPGKQVLVRWVWGDLGCSSRGLPNRFFIIWRTA